VHLWNVLRILSQTRRRTKTSTLEQINCGVDLLRIRTSYAACFGKTKASAARACMAQGARAGRAASPQGLPCKLGAELLPRWKTGRRGPVSALTWKSSRKPMGAQGPPKSVTCEL